MGDTLEATKLAPNLPSTGLHACPIPEPFKSAVTGIPSAVLQIIAIVEAAKGNADNAKELALYIGQVTDATIRPLQNLLLDFTHQPLKEGLDQFSQTLELVQNQIRDLLSRSRARRLLRYSSDASKIATMKQKIQDAITSIRLETNFTTTYAVAQIAQNQEISIDSSTVSGQGTTVLPRSLRV
ncbi:hypothetical protein FRB95_012133 [Tulasnella sp. JGI-2019a]|nr:hypothetical protein FRB95_012133 [Tulasnella sp. JGI-2019a]